jgi:hypothetical protein
MNLVKQAKRLMDKGVYDPNDLFHIIYENNRVHYSKVREAIHNAKVA